MTMYDGKWCDQCDRVTLHIDGTCEHTLRHLSRTRPYVEAFGDEMEGKLAMNRHKGDAEGWSRMSARDLMVMLREEVDELAKELPSCRCRECVEEFKRKNVAQRIRFECADVGNIAMMIANVAGDMRPKFVDPLDRYARGVLVDMATRVDNEAMKPLYDVAVEERDRARDLLRALVQKLVAGSFEFSHTVKHDAPEYQNAVLAVASWKGANTA